MDSSCSSVEDPEMEKIIETYVFLSLSNNPECEHRLGPPEEQSSQLIRKPPSISEGLFYLGSLGNHQPVSPAENSSPSPTYDSLLSNVSSHLSDAPLRNEEAQPCLYHDSRSLIQQTLSYCTSWAPIAFPRLSITRLITRTRNIGTQTGANVSRLLNTQPDAANFSLPLFRYLSLRSVLNIFPYTRFIISVNNADLYLYNLLYSIAIIITFYFTCVIIN